MAGMGKVIVANAERVGVVNPKLCVAVAEAESSLGISPRARQYKDPYGMTGANIVFPSFEAATIFWFDNMKKHTSWAPWQTGYDIQHEPPYCATTIEEYAKNVTIIVNRI